MTPIKRFIGSAATLAALTTSATAAINYVDITTSNTTLVGGAAWTPLPDQGANDDGQWGTRAFGNNATIYQNFGNGGTDNAERLQTVVTGLPQDTYRVYAYFWTDGGWGIEAATTNNPAGELPIFKGGDPGTTAYYTGAENATVFSSSLATNPFETDVMIREGNRTLIQADLGTVEGTEITVFLDDVIPTDGGRTWLDGIGYAVVPEPSSSGLIALAGFGFLMRRRRSA